MLRQFELKTIKTKGLVLYDPSLKSQISPELSYFQSLLSVMFSKQTETRIRGIL